MQPKFSRFAISKASDTCLALAVMFGFDVSLRVKMGDVSGAILLAGTAAAGGLAVFAIELLREASKRSDGPLAIRPLEDRRDSVPVFIAKLAAYGILYLSATLLPIAAFVALTGEPWPQLPSLWFGLIVATGVVVGLAWLRTRQARRQHHAQSRKAGVLAE